MNILHLSFSPRGQAGESYRLSRKIVDLLLKNDPAATVRAHALGDGTLAHVDADYALAQHAAGAGASLGGTALRSEALIQELESADVLVVGTPMHNLGVPSTLKAWIDHVVRAGRTFDVSATGKRGLLRDRPIYVAVASGGVFSGERARQTDFLTPYLRAVLGTIGLRDLTFFSVEGTGHGADAVAEARVRTDGLLRAHFEGGTQ
ncbi:MAG: NAD(P)H-dependent oxidoreductase [Betaproteobacteria bacterium]